MVHLCTPCWPAPSSRNHWWSSLNSLLKTPLQHIAGSELSDLPSPSASSQMWTLSTCFVVMHLERQGPPRHDSFQRASWKGFHLEPSLEWWLLGNPNGVLSWNELLWLNYMALQAPLTWWALWWEALSIIWRGAVKRMWNHLHKMLALISLKEMICQRAFDYLKAVTWARHLGNWACDVGLVSSLCILMITCCKDLVSL